MKKITTAFLRDNIMCDSIGKKRDGSGHFVFRRGYFYRHGIDQHKFAKRISFELSELGIDHKIVDCGDHWAPFRGGASIAQSSHFWVQVEIIE